MSELHRVATTFLVVREAYLATLGIALVCAYLGLFCVLRRIVFTGVALAQLAAAGVAGSFFLGQHGPAWLAGPASEYGSTVGSLGASVLGALGLQSRHRGGKITSDAVVGLVYAGATAVAMLLVVGSSMGQSELQNILAGEVLLSRQGELRSLAIGLAAVTLVHLLYRRDFLLVSFDTDFSRALGLPERRLQLLLLGSLAVAVALALKVGGLLLVFSLLVLPPSAGLTLGDGLGRSTLLALGMACGGTLVGFLAAIWADFPVAPTITVALLAFAGLARIGARYHRLGQAVAVGSALSTLAAFGVGLVLLLAPQRQVEPAPAPGAQASPVADGEARAAGHPDEHLMEAVRDLGEGDLPARLKAIQHLAASRDPRAVEPLVEALVDEEQQVRDAAGKALVALSDLPASQQALRDLLGGDDPECRVCAALGYVHLQDPRGIAGLMAALEDPDTPLMLQEQVLAHLVTLTGGDDFGYDPFGDPEANAQALARWRSWWQTAKDRVRWDQKKRAFSLAE